MNFTLHIWRQKNGDIKGDFVTYQIDNIDEDTSFLEMLDQLNEQLIAKDQDCIVFDYDCREGICGACSLVINGYPHGDKKATTTCQLYMRDYKHQTELWVEPWRAESFPVIKDLTVDRTSFDNIIQSGGYVSVHTGSAPEANALLVDKHSADEAFNSATCIGCGPVLLYVQMHQQPCLLPLKLHTYRYCHKVRLKSKIVHKKCLIKWKLKALVVVQIIDIVNVYVLKEFRFLILPR